MGWRDAPIVKPPSALSRLGQGAIGAIKGYGEQMYDTMGPMALGPLGYAAAEMSGGSEDAFRPSNPDQQTGYNLETVAEYAGGLAGAAPAMARGAARVIRPIAARVGPGAASAAKNVVINAAAGMVPGGTMVRSAVKAIGEAATKEAAKKAAPRAARPVLKKVAEKTAQSTAKAAPKATPVAAKKAAEVAAPAASRGADVAAKHKALMQFAKEIAEKNPKVGEKIWVLLDDAGTPIKHLTPDQAGAAARKGLKTSWARNLWAR